MDDDTLKTLGIDSPVKPGGTAAMVASLLEKNKANAADLTAAKNKEEAPIQAGLTQDMQARQALAEKGPERQELPKMTQPQATDLTGVFGALLVFAALAGGQAKAHATGALRAMNGVLEGMHAGDQEKIAQAQKQFETDYKRAVETNKEKLDDYKRTLENMNLGIDMKIEQLRQIAIKYQDQEKLQLLDRGDISAITQAIHADQQATQHAQDRADKWSMHNDEMRKPPSGYERTADGKLKIIEGGPADPEVRGEQKTLQPVQVATVEKDLFETKKFLTKARQMSSDTASAFFMDTKEPGFMSRWVKKELTPEEQQLYDVYANRVANAIVGMQSVGRYRGTNLSIDEARKLVPVPGDTQATITAKLDYIEAFARDTDDMLSRLSKSHKKYFDGDAEASGTVTHPEYPGFSIVK